MTFNVILKGGAVQVIQSDDYSLQGDRYVFSNSSVQNNNLTRKTVATVDRKFVEKITFVG